MAALPICEDEIKEMEPIVFHTPAIYNTKVKIHNWQMHTLAEPRDNKEIFPPKGNLHLSSYKRLGPGTICTGISETQAMLSQIELKDQYEPIIPHRALHKMKKLIEEVPEEEEPTLTDILYDAEEARRMDYRTTSGSHYRLPYPMKPRALPLPPKPEPWLLHRRTIGYSLEELERRKGINVFLDDNMELHREVADIKLKKHKLHSFRDYSFPEYNYIDKKECTQLITDKIKKEVTDQIEKINDQIDFSDVKECQRITSQIQQVIDSPSIKELKITSQIQEATDSSKAKECNLEIIGQVHETNDFSNIKECNAQFTEETQEAIDSSNVEQSNPQIIDQTQETTNSFNVEQINPQITDQIQEAIDSSNVEQSNLYIIDQTQKANDYIVKGCKMDEM
ncbi:uncharacterized protein LOC108004497 isoform X1 [Apis cerana]|uniref:uncharacterized protein LOC108004497 isoform X1 n=1 Tax=Apis cerana TaxID=7461 RepID=UPI002B237060|nr:uncharacterized protein LOC108004497 isoform X1 [Apis cerana]